MQEKALQQNTVRIKIAPVTTNEPKTKMVEWLSCWTKIDIIETVIMLFLGAGKEKGPLDRKQYVHVLHLLPLRISLNPTSPFTQSLSKMMFISTLGTGVDHPNGQSGVHLLMVHLSGGKQQQWKSIMKWKGRKMRASFKTAKLFRLFKSSPVQTVQGYKRWCLQWVQLPGQDDSATDKQELSQCHYPITPMGRDREVDALPVPHNGLTTSYNMRPR